MTRTHCTTCRKPTTAMRTDAERCGVCQQPYPSPKAAPVTPRETGSLFAPVDTYPYARGSETSKAAALSLDDGRTATQRRRIMLYIAEHGPATDQELETALEIEGNAVRPRRGSLVAEGWLEDSGEKRPTASGRQATVWQLGPKGREWTRGRAA